MEVMMLIKERLILISCNGIEHRNRFSKGFKYIVQLINDFNNDIPFTTLTQPEFQETLQLEQFDCEQTAELRELSFRKRAVLGSNLRLPMTDSRTINDCYREIKYLQMQLAEAEDNNDLGRRESIYEEIGKIQEYLSNTVNPINGMINSFNENQQRVNHAVLTSIHRALAVIRQKDFQLALALRRSLYLGTICFYRPVIGLRVTIKQS